MNITIVILTKDRSEILKKTLNAYVEFNFTGEIIIGDDSSDREFNNLNKEVLTLKNKLKIYHFRGPRIEHPSRIVRSVSTQVKVFELLKTDYVTSKGDDDFGFPVFFQKGINFLENYPEYSCFMSPEIKTFYNQNWVLTKSFIKKWHKVEDEDPLERCINYSTKVNLPWTGVCRSEAFKKILKSKETTKRDIFTKSNDRSFSFFDLEIPWCLAILANGKVFYDPSLISQVRGEFEGVDRITNMGINKNDVLSLAGTIYELQQKDSYLSLRELHEDIFYIIKQNNSKYDDEILKNDIWVIIWRFFHLYQGRLLSKPAINENHLNKKYIYILYKKLKKLTTDYLLRDKFNLKKSRDYLDFVNFIKKK